MDIILKLMIPINMIRNYIFQGLIDIIVIIAYEILVFLNLLYVLIYCFFFFPLNKMFFRIITTNLFMYMILNKLSRY